MAIDGAMKQAGIDRVDEVIMGNVLGAGQGQAPARQASFAAGLDETIPATTLNKMCGSGMKAAMIGFDQIKLGQSKILAVGGMESMSNAPYLLPKMRGGARLGNDKIIEFFNPVKYIIKDESNEKKYEINSENAFYNINTESLSFGAKRKKSSLQ